MSPLRVDSRRAGESWITGITESRRRVRDHRALLAGVKISQVEVIEVALLERHSEERRPVYPVSQRQFGRHFPGVLGVQADEVLVQVQRVGIRLPELRHLSEEE